MTNERPPEAFMPSERFHGITASPDGTRVAYFLEGRDAMTLYAKDIAGDRSRIRTDDGWFPTDTIIWGGSEQLFTTRRELGSPSTDIYVVSLEGDLRPVIIREERCLPVDASPDGRWLLFGTQHDGAWNLHLHDASHDQTEHLADVSGHHYHRQAGFSPDGRYLAFHAPDFEGDTDRVRSHLRELGEDDDQPIAAGRASGDVECRSWNEQGDRLLLVGDGSNGSQYGVFDIETGDTDWFESDASLDVMLSDGGFLGTTGGEMTQSVVVVDGSGSIRRTVLDDGICELPKPIGRPTFANDEVLLTYETPTQPPTAARYLSATDTLETILAESLEDIDTGELVDPERVAYDSADGTEIHGLLFDSGERLSPAVVDVLGGPTKPVRQEFSPRIQYLVSQGYAVLQPNYRGSAGRGDAFKNAIKGDFGGVEVADVAAGGRWLATREWIDSDRVAVFGQSWGGYNAYVQLVRHSDTWAACAGLNGPTDLTAMHEEYGQPAVIEELLGGSPAERPDYYHERSPINHVERARCPVLILHGEEDPTATDGSRFRDALVASGNQLGEDIEYHVLEGQDHGSSTRRQRAEVAERLAAFLDRKL